MLNHPKLTARQQQILDLVQTALARTGAPPTRAEIATAMGFKSANAAEEHLQALARKDAEGAVQLMVAHLEHVEQGLQFEREIPSNDLSMALSSITL